ncbi:MAG: DUF4982 domain-containing protein [Bacteroidaceae bacterium]|nr:DUF4982 domain-containing protein [Bacteroidaceae bacterium]
MKKILFPLVLATLAVALRAQRSETLLKDGWKFHLGDVENAEKRDFIDENWASVTVPHDWAITGPFDRKWDLQKVAVRQNGESVATWKTGRSGGLPYIGVGWYRTHFVAPRKGRTTLVFDGAMSEAHVYVNGREAIFWPYGYNSFHVDVTDLVNKDGTPNTLAVRLENREQSSRWYSGAGLYRNVRLITTGELHVPVWGTHVTTPHVEPAYASVALKTQVENADGQSVRILTDILDPDGHAVAHKDNTQKLLHGQPLEQHFLICDPSLWSPETPMLYTAVSHLLVGADTIDTYTTRFGIRSIEFVADRGFFLNGQKRKFQGVCLHHDLGPLGAAVNRSAIRHQLELLKRMGCDAIRTSHNMPTPELVEMCDEMGFFMMLEPFDEWDVAKCQNGYHRYFKEWAERDMVNMIHHYRNHPSVVMWSVGNEVPTQWKPEGYRVAKMLQDICHREDPTRPVTCGMDQVDAVLKNGFAAMLDIPGFNYRTHKYVEAYGILPQNLLLGSETSSTVSTRGTYMFPAQLKKGAMYENHQSSGYDLEACSWSNVPDEDFALAEDYDWTLGQFVWTGFDYLGEPSPYDTDAWPSHSSLFGIIDLASLPKDRYWLYRSHWAPDSTTLHVLPHWTWPGREGEVTPVFVYTNAPSAELFVNGKSQGIQRKLSAGESDGQKDKDPLWRQRRYRLMWTDVVYEPGELRVVAYNADGSQMAEQTVRTAGRPHHLALSTDRKALSADGEDLAYVTISVVDKDGNLCPDATSLVEFSAKGAGHFRAAANGDATCLDQFHLPRHHAFAGQLTAIVQSGVVAGTLTFTAKARGLQSASFTLPVE